MRVGGPCTSQEYDSSPSGWVRMKFLPRVMKKIHTARDENNCLLFFGLCFAYSENYFFHHKAQSIVYFSRE